MREPSDRTIWPTVPDSGAGSGYEAYAAVYHLLFGDQVEDVPFYLSRAAALAPPGQPLIELGVGTGRLAAHLLAAGHDVVGVDACPGMLAEAAHRLDAGHCRLVTADLRTMSLGLQTSLIIGAYGVTAHLLTEADRQAAFRSAFEHLVPGGWLIYDDRPSWMLPATEAGTFTVERELEDPSSGLLVRLTTSRLPLADRPLTLSDEVIDWLRDGQLVQRVAIRLHFRDIPWPAELALLQAAGFDAIQTLGGFDGRPFDHDRPTANQRLIVCCRRGPS